jgi:hypothetical protein
MIIQSSDKSSWRARFAMSPGGAIGATLAHAQSDLRPALGGIEDDDCGQAGFSGRDTTEILWRQCTAR